METEEGLLGPESGRATGVSEVEVPPTRLRVVLEGPVSDSVSVSTSLFATDFTDPVDFVLVLAGDVLVLALALLV